MKKQKQKSVVKKRGIYIALALALFVGAPVLGAILVQNFSEWTVVVARPPIEHLQGADADYDGDGDDTTGYLQVDLGQTVTNNDSGLPTPGGNDTTLAHEVITFTCFKGDRTYYTDVIQLQNTTATEDWDVTLTVEADIEGSPAVEDTFTAGTADVWLFTSQVNTAVTPVSSLPNPANYGHATTPLTDWYDNDPNDATDTLDAIQLEVVGGTMSVANATTGVFEIPAGEQRQMALVVDCGRNMAPMTTGSGTFRVTLSTTPQ